MSDYGLDFLELSDTESSPLRDLPSSKIYKKFNNNNITSSSDGNCAGVKVYNGGDEFKKLCKKFEKNSEELVTLVGNNVNQDTRCSYLTYWIYDEVRKKLNKSPYKDNRNSIINDLDEASSKIFHSLMRLSHSCYINIEDNFDNWKEEKILYDYFKNCDSIIEYAKNVDKSKCTDYYKYVSNIKELYKKKKVDEDCCSSRFFECNDYFNCEDKYNPNVILSKLKCNGHHSTEETAEVTTLSNKAESETSNLVNTLGFNYFRCSFIEQDKKDGSGLARCSVYPLSPNSFENPYYPVVNQGDSDVSSTDDEEEGEEAEGEEKPETEEAVITQKNDKEHKVCPLGKISSGPNGECLEPNVRLGTAIGKKWIGRSPTKAEIEKFSNFNFKNLFVIDDNLLKNNTFRFSTACALSVGVLITMFIYYKVIRKFSLKIYIVFFLPVFHVSYGFIITY